MEGKINLGGQAPCWRGNLDRSHDLLQGFGLFFILARFDISSGFNQRSFFHAAKCVYTVRTGI